MSKHKALNYQQTDTKVWTAIIIGTGFAGLGMAVALKKNGIHDFLIVEKAKDVGGVWRDNSYPGAACDVPSHLYSFSFFPNPNWTRKFAPQQEIWSYLQDCACAYQLLGNIQFDSEVRSADYHEQTRRWRVVLTNGTELYSQFLITAMGQLSRPALPKIEGMGNFKGQAFHSAKWNHDVDLTGQRVAVIGTGASATQFVPAIATRVKSMSVFQRSPAYILPRPDRAYGAFERALCRWLPGFMKLQRLKTYLQYESQALAFTRFKSLMQLAGGLPFRALLKRQVADPLLRQKMTPQYPIGCKRILLSSDYLATFNQTHVTLVTDAIRHITPLGIETTDGKVHEVDIIVYGTGFAATEFLAPLSVKGRDGKDLHAAWAQGAKAYLGITVPDFPNLFLLYGPNTNLGHNSIVHMLESQIAHVMRCLHALRANNAQAIEVRPDVYAAYTAHIQNRLSRTVWMGCTSWYVDERGYNSTNWPGFTLSYRWLTRTARMSAYRFLPAKATSSGVIA